MFEKYIFQVPKHLQPLVESGALERFGTIVKDSGTGKIVGHLQQTGAGQKIMGSLVGSPFSGLDTVSSLAANAQLAGLKRMVEGLQLLQYVNLGIGLAGIGISVAGFAIVNKKLTSIQQTVEQLALTINRNFQQLYLNQLNRDLNAIRGLLEDIEASKRLSAPKVVLVGAASKLTEVRAGVRGHIEHQLQQNAFDEQLFTQLTSAMLLCDNARLEAYVLANEYDSAHYSATAIAASYSELFDDVTPYDLNQKPRITHQHSAYDKTSILQNRSRKAGNENIVRSLRDLTDAASTKPFLIEELDQRGIYGSDYLESLRIEANEPLVLVEFED